MNVSKSSSTGRRAARRELLHQYVSLQRELVEGDPASSAYQATVRAFRQMGYMMIASGFEADLDRLLRLRVLDGGHAVPASPADRSRPELHLIEQRPLP